MHHGAPGPHITVCPRVCIVPSKSISETSPSKSNNQASKQVPLKVLKLVFYVVAKKKKKEYVLEEAGIKWDKWRKRRRQA